jgi:hypothetical protein
MTDSNAAAVKATEDLARGLIAVNIPPHVLQNRFLRRGLLSVRAERLCGACAWLHALRSAP